MTFPDINPARPAAPLSSITGNMLDRAAAPARASKVRYVVLAMIFLITTVNYADRATLSLTGSAMRTEFCFGAVQLGYMFSAFSWAYVLAELPGGWLLDRYGQRRVCACSIFAWSLFTLLQAGAGWGPMIA